MCYTDINNLKARVFLYLQLNIFLALRYNKNLIMTIKFYIHVLDLNKSCTFTSNIKHYYYKSVFIILSIGTVVYTILIID